MCFVVMWVKIFQYFDRANQETNNSIEAYHYQLKLKFLKDMIKKGSIRLDNIIYKLQNKVNSF